MASAQASVFATRELLTQILLQLPIRDLLLAQRVCTSWNETITASVSLQEALFFRCIPGTAQAKIQVHHNPLLTLRFPLWFNDHETPCGPYENALLLSTQGKDLHTLELAKSKEATDAYMRAEASWRKMLVVQPAVHDLVIENIHDGFMVPSKVTARVRFEHGLRMGALYDITAKWVRDRDTGFGVRWCMFPPNVRPWEKVLEEQEGSGSIRASDLRDLRNELERFGKREVKNQVDLEVAAVQGSNRSPDDLRPVHDFVSLGYEEVEMEYRDIMRVDKTRVWPLAT